MRRHGVTALLADPRTSTAMTNNNRPPDPNDTAWAPSEVAAQLQISRRHLDDVRREDPSFPPPTMLGRCPR